MKVGAEEIGFSYDRGAKGPVLSGVSLDLPEGRITVVIGPSGSGKSTLLQILAGLLTPDAGAVRFDGRDVTRVPAERRDVGVVFQSYALFPHLTVRDNVAFGLTTRRLRLPRAEAEARVQEAAALLGIEPLLGRRPAELSGGERQRVAVARAIAPRPALLLLDEPLSALDARLRRSVRAELAALLARLGTTAFYVTHDQEEAMLLADHLVVLRDGRVEQAGAPLDLYQRPATAFVASFLGEANLLPVEVAAPLFRGGPPPAAIGSGGVLVLLRPEDLAVAPEGAPATVVESRGLGPWDRVVARLATGAELLVHLPPGMAPGAGAVLRLVVLPGRGHGVAEGPHPLAQGQGVRASRT